MFFFRFVVVFFRFEEIESLPFFSALDWSSMHSHPAPFVPRPDDIMDTTYFNGKSDDASFATSPLQPSERYRRQKIIYLCLAARNTMQNLRLSSFSH